MVTEISPISDQIGTDITEIDFLIDALKKQDAKNTEQNLTEFLNLYIIAKTRHDSAGAKAILDKISSLHQTYENDLKKANELEGKLNSIANNPSDQTANELAYLQSWIETLKQDLTSGNMSNL